MIREYIYWKRTNGKDGVLINSIVNRSKINVLADNGDIKYFFVFPVNYVRKDFHSAKFPLMLARYYIKTPDGKKRVIDQKENGEVFLSSRAKSYRELRDECMQNFKRNYLIKMFREHKGNISQVARESKLNRKSVSRLADECGIDVNDYR